MKHLETFLLQNKHLKKTSKVMLIFKNQDLFVLEKNLIHSYCFKELA